MLNAHTSADERNWKQATFVMLGFVLLMLGFVAAS